MSVPAHIEEAVTASLVNAGRLQRGRPLSFRALHANAERKDHLTLLRFIVSDGAANLALLITGPALSDLKRRSDLFCTTYPTLGCPVFASGVVEENEFLLATYFEGSTAEQMLEQPDQGITGVLAALESVAKAFDGATQPSTQAAALDELRQLWPRILEIEYWSPADRGFLTHVVFPFAEERLVVAGPKKRVTNGDFTLANLLIGATGAVAIVDYEQAAATHFYWEDWLRITYWKAPRPVRDFALKNVPDLVAAKLYLWLKQLVFESAVIRPEKARVDIRHWAAEIRNLIIQNLPDLQASIFWPIAGNQDGVAAGDAGHAKALELFHYARHMANRVGRSETKIQYMQHTFSWRCTAWLRALRRTLVDRTRRTPAHRHAVSPPAFPFSIEDFASKKAARLHHHLDTTEDDIVVGRELCLTGWVFSPEPPTLVKVHARVGSRLYPGDYGLERPEIAEKFFPQAHSRFQINVALQAGDARLDLEAMTEDGEWLLFYTKSLQHPSHLPASWAIGVEAVRSRYRHWVQLYDSLNDRDLAALSRKAKELPVRPLISLIMPVYNTEERWLKCAIETVRAQVYEKWELCIADDASTQPQVRRILERYAKTDPRIKLVFRPDNGHISAASNSALELVTGDFTALVDHDDELAPHALYCVAELLSRQPNAEIIYSDEDKISEDGERFDPHFKTDWNPDLLRGQNYLSHLTVYRTITLRAVGGFRTGFEGSQDWDLALRVSEHVAADRIHHIPRVLYHWRTVPGSTATLLESKDYATEAARKTLLGHFERLGKNVSLELVKGSHWHVRYPVPSPAPLVTLIIPTRNRRELLIACVESIFKRTRYPNFEILVADNDSDDPQLLAFYEQMKNKGRFNVVACPGPFNFSGINNRAIRHACGELVGLLNNDLEAMHSDWLDELVGHALRPEIGVVGAKLYYPDMRVQHAGVITGLGGVAGHAFKHFPRNDPGTPQFRPHVAHNITAVTAACIVMRKAIFETVDGFDEKHLKIAFNDVDFCLRVQSRGYLNLFTPFAEFIHHESASRGAEDSPEKIARFGDEIAYMKKRWGERLLNDPAYSPNLTLDSEDFAYAFPPRMPRLSSSS